MSIGAVQKQFIDELKRVLSQHHGHGRALTEGAAVTCVKLCKSSTYVNITDRANVLFVLVQTVNQDLKVHTTATADVASDTTAGVDFGVCTKLHHRVILTTMVILQREIGRVIKEASTFLG